MGYYNPVYVYGEENLVRDAKEAGANGFIIVDLPPEEAVSFRDACTSAGLSFIPLVAPSTSPQRLKLLSSIADSFIYVVSRMGVTGSKGGLNPELPEFCRRVRQHVGDRPIAVGFGVSTQDHFRRVAQIADGVVIGSKIIDVLQGAGKGEAAAAIETYCRDILGSTSNGTGTREIGLTESIKLASETNVSKPSKIIGSHTNGVKSEKLVDTAEMASAAQDYVPLPSTFGGFGGSYVPESLFECLVELEREFVKAINDPKFWEEFKSYYPYMGRPSRLQYADRLTDHVGGARIWLKREDLNHTGSHKINNAIGQILIAKRLGKTRVIAETGAGQHGVATATVAAKFGMKCSVFMGAEDVRRQALNVFRMKLLGAEVISVESGTQTLRDAVNEALRSWVTDLSTTHYIIGSAIGPHPFPTIVRTFQSVIGQETKQEFMQLKNKLPDAVIACVGGGSNSVGMFHPFAKDASVRLVGVEAGGDGVDTKRHSATLSGGSIGVLHGVRTYILQNSDGQVQDTHSVCCSDSFNCNAYNHRYRPGSIIRVLDLSFPIGRRQIELNSSWPPILMRSKDSVLLQN